DPYRWMEAGPQDPRILVLHFQKREKFGILRAGFHPTIWICDFSSEVVSRDLPNNCSRWLSAGESRCRRRLCRKWNGTQECGNNDYSSPKHVHEEVSFSCKPTIIARFAVQAIVFRCNRSWKMG